jgi:hypothetical protein
MLQGRMPTHHRTPGAPSAEQLDDFSREAQKYFEDISDPAARRFTLRYTEYLQAKAHGIAISEPSGESGVSMLDCRLIRSVLRNLYKKHLS